MKCIGKGLKRSKQCLLYSRSAHLSSTTYPHYNVIDTERQQHNSQDKYSSRLCSNSTRSMNPIALHWISESRIAHFLILHPDTNWLSLTLTSFFTCHFLTQTSLSTVLLNNLKATQWIVPVDNEWRNCFHRALRLLYGEGSSAEEFGWKVTRAKLFLSTEAEGVKQQGR